MEQLSVRTSSRTEFVDVTIRIRDTVASCGVSDGHCVVFVPHTTAGVTINENADPAVVRDTLMELKKMVPFDDGYSHAEGNSAAHIKASMMGSSCTVIVEGGELRLGRWQGIYLCEFDGPRSREVWVSCR